MKINNVINEATIFLKNSNIQSAKLDSELLLSKVIKKNRNYILLNLKQNLTQKNLIDYKELIKKRAKGKPTAYLTGKKEFWKFEFNAYEDVLIPRPETELVVEQVLRLMKNKSKLNILEIGVGSGCIILSILKEKKNFNGVGMDISKRCVEACNKNASKLGLSNRLKLYKSDIDNFELGKYDLIISNPPYIKKLDFNSLDKNIVNFEPKMALYGGLDGLSEIKRVINKSSNLIKLNGKLVLEIAFDQKNKVKKLLEVKGFYINKILKDLAGHDRCIISTKI